MKEQITIAGKMTLPADHAARVLHPHSENAVYTVYEIAGTRYVSISGNTRGTVELTALKDLYVNASDGLMKASHAPVRVNAADMPTVYTSSLKELDPVNIPVRGVTGNTPARRINHTTSPDAATLDDIALFVIETIGEWTDAKQREAYDYIGMYVSDWFIDYDLTGAEIDYIVAEVRDAFNQVD